ncbi:receptor-type tyrosine-protein phosphatase H isoform X3 [Xenopus laevis]|uniref:protein-tyrosine-phosphatase n=1 Tax=Xenopus laevis TaxID=8355 RepID=A0A8J1L7M6_XENLA|nr:receptor-type tyrosine-protein phosphatase H isoform X3 [Xenopus laevis]
MAFISIDSAHCKALLLLSQIFLIWHGGTPVTAHSEPSPAKNVAVTGQTTTSVTLSWALPNDTNSSNYTYEIMVVSDGGTALNTTSKTNSTEVKDLKAGVTYSFSVFTVTQDNITSSAVSVNATTKPSPVQNVTVTGQTTTSVNLSWALPTDTNSSNYTYVIVVVSDGVTVLNTTSNTNSTEVKDLKAGVTYSFSVYTVTWDKIESSAVSVKATTKPSPVQNVAVTGRTTTSVNLSWALPTDTNSSTYTYVIVVVSDGVTVSNTTSNTNSTEVKDLKAGVTYSFSVYTVTWDKIESSAVSVKATTKPSPVQNVTITGRTTTSVNLSWALPTDTNSSTYTYEIVVVSDGGTALNTTSNTNSTEVKDLKAGVTYSFSVYTVTWDNIKSSAVSVKVTTKPSSVQNVAVTGRTTTSVNLSWALPTDTNSSTYTYVIVVVSDGVTVSNTTSNTNSTEVKDLKAGVTYSFSVYTVTWDNIESSAVSVKVTTKPSPVQNVAVTGRTTTSVNLSWALPNDTNSSTYTYVIVVVSDGVTVSNTTSNTNSTEVKDLKAGVTYSFSVYTVTWDNIESSAVSVKVTTKPSSVKNVTVTGRTTTSVNLSWALPTDTNSSTYTYVIVVVSDGVTVSNTTSNTNSTEVKDLKAGVTYSFSVYTVTQDNIESSAVSVKATTRPSPVQNVAVTDRTTTSVTLSWALPTDTNSSTYTYEIMVVSDGVTVSNTTSNTNSTEVKDLKAGVTYSFSVYTVTWDNITSSAVSVAATTTPNAPANVSGNPVNTTAVSISWTPPSDSNNKNYTYTVLWNEKPGTLNRSSTTSNTTVIGGLTAGNRYNVSVISVINNVTSVEVMTYLQTNPEPLGSNITVTITNSTVTVVWTNPSGGSYSGIEIKAEAEDGTHNVTKNVTSQSINQGTLDGLIPGTDYKLTIRSYSASSTTTQSSGRISRRAAADTIITYSEPVTKQIQMDPNTVTGIECYKINGGYKLSVNFFCPTGSFTSIKILADDNVKETIPASDCKNVTVTNLQPARQYKIKVTSFAKEKQASVIILCATDDVGVIVGSIFGVLLFLLLVGLLAFFVVKKRRGLNNKFGQGSRSLDKIKIKRVPSVIKTAFPDYYQRQHADSDFGFAEEYQQLSTVGTDQSKRAAELTENRSKNRFTNVLPYDNSRVKLNQIDGNNTSDYINANYMPGYNSSKEFIASQGPLPNTSADFWRMVWENQVSTIVMLTNCTENGRVKCDHYWPLDYTPCTYGDITVTVTSETILPDWTIRDFSIKHAKQQGNKYARHFHFTVWPDHGVPENTTAIVQFRSLVRDYMDQKRSSGPTIVHCSAGVGRTGTLIALDYLIQKMEKEQRIGIYGFVQKMRLNRPLMVQTESQYVFLNKCMLDLLQTPPEENIYENQIGGDLIYENASVVRDYQKDNL